MVLGCPSAGHIQDPRAHRSEPLTELTCCRNRRDLIEIEVQDRLPSPGGFLKGQKRTTNKRSMREDQRCVRISDVERCANGRVVGVSFDKADIVLRDGSVLSNAAAGYPATGAKPVTAREVERGTIGARLATGNDLLKHLGAGGQSYLSSSTSV